MSARKTTVTVASAAALAMAGASIKHYEGFAPTVVPDRLANGLPTGGYGETEGVRLGETHSEAFWSDRLAVRIKEEYDAGLGKCVHVDLPDSARSMLISETYNAGVGLVCRSSMVRKFNAGDNRGGCEAMRDFAITSHPRGPRGPAVVQHGLQNRRNDEAKKCLAGLNQPKEAVPVPVPVLVGPPAPIVTRVVVVPPAPKPACFLPWIFKCKDKA